MRKTSKSVLYSTIKSTIKKLGISAEDTIGVINYIKFIENSVTPEVTNSSNKATEKVSTEDIILNVLNKNSNLSYSIQNITEETGFSYPKVQISLRKLKTARKIKVVDYIPGVSGPSKLLFQTWRSPLKALKTVTEKQGYTTINGFISDNKELLLKNKCRATFASIVEHSGITTYPLSLGIGITKGYKTSDLKSLIENANKKSTKKHNKKVNQVKRKYTKKTKIQTAEPSTFETKSSFSLLGSLFKKKNQNTSELIKF